jgi:hypothetical protein
VTDDLRPDPSRGREVLDAIDRYKARLAAKGGASNVLPFRAPIVFDGDRADDLCPYCGNAIGNTRAPRDSKDGRMHRLCFRRWFRLTVEEREARRIVHAGKLAGRRA